MKKYILILKKHWVSLLFVTLTITNGSLSAQNPEFTTQGTDFWVTFGQNMRVENPDGDMGASHPYEALNLQIRIAAVETTQVSFIFTNDPSYNTTVTVQAGTIHTKALSSGEKHAAYLPRPSSVALNTPYSNKNSKSIRIISDKPISVYALTDASGTTDATNVFPAEILGTAYYHLSYKADQTASTPTYSYTCFDGYAVIATKNNTIIYENNVQKAVLQEGQVYYSYSAAAGEFTGRYITSTHPIAYYVINTGTRIPNSNTAATECLYQLLGPLNGWGTKFMVPVTKRGKERIRIMASQNGTKITIPQASGYSVKGSSGGASLSNINAGNYVELEITDRNTGLYFSANNPVQVCSYMMGATAFPGEGALGDQGDPSMVLIPPIEQSVPSSTISRFYIYPGATPITHHALIVTRTDTRDQTTMAIGTGADQPLSGGTWSTNTASGYSFYSLELTQDRAYTFTNPSGLTIMGYAYGSSKSYYYLAGAAARNLNPHFRVNDEHYQNLQNKIFCTTDIAIEAAIYSQAAASNSLKWFIDNDPTPVFVDQTTWNVSDLGLAPGDHTILMEVLNLNNRKDSCIYHFTLIDPVTITGNNELCTGNNYPFTGTPAGGQWTTSNVNIASVDQTGLVRGIRGGTADITYRHTDECFFTKTITVYEEPRITVQQGQRVCLGIAIRLNATPAGGNWISSDPSVATVDGNGVVTSIIPGNVSFTYTLNGCSSTTSVFEIVEDCPPYEVWNWEDFKLAIDAVNSGICTTINLMQNIGFNTQNSGNGIGTGPNGEDCPHTEPAKKIGNYYYDRPAGGFFEMWPGREGWKCTRIIADSLFFEGNGNTIDGLYFVGDDYEVQPSLFGEVRYAEFKNLSIKTTGDGFQYGQHGYNTGGFVADALDVVSFVNCAFDGRVYSMSATQAGGFVGNARKHITIKNCSTSGKVELRYGNSLGVGGFVGNVRDGITIEGSVSNITLSTGSFIGGFVGTANNDIRISNSVSNATIEGRTNWQPGWFVGSTWGYVDDYVGGTIGGIIGALYTDRQTSQNNGSSITGTSMTGTLISNDTTYKRKPYYFKDFAGGAIGFIGSKYDTSTYHNTASILIDTFAMKGHINAPESFYVGGLIGGINLTDQGNVTVRASYASDNIIAQKKAGGLIGLVEGEGNTYITESYFRGNVSSDSSAGLVAILRQTNGNHNLLSIENSYVAGSVFGNDVAGFIYNTQGNLLIDNSFGAINLTLPVDSFTGKGILLGIAGPYNIAIQEVFYDRNLAQDVPHIIENNSGTLTDMAQARSTFDMPLRSTYPGNWFSAGPWTIINEQTYPYLKWQVRSALTEPENNYAMKSTEFSVENSGIWTEFTRAGILPDSGDYLFRFTMDTGNHAEEAFFPYIGEKITFISNDTTVNVNGLNAQDTIVACGVSQSGIIGIYFKGYALFGTVYPFVYTQNPDLDTLFPISVRLYAVPSEDSGDPLGDIINGEPLYTSSTIYYDGTIFVEGTPKNPRSSILTDNPGLPISWNMIGKTQGSVDNELLTENDNIPSSPIGLYNFNHVDSGSYVLAISRPGFLPRFAKITIDRNGTLGHRELLPGDVNGDFSIDFFDVSAIHAKFSEYPNSEYKALFDLNGDGKVDQDDVTLLLFYISADIEMYRETMEWLMEY